MYKQYLLILSILCFTSCNYFNIVEDGTIYVAENTFTDGYFVMTPGLNLKPVKKKYMYYKCDVMKLKPISVLFSDNYEAEIHLKLSWSLPKDKSKIIDIHKMHKSYLAMVDKIQKITDYELKKYAANTKAKDTYLVHYHNITLADHIALTINEKTGLLCNNVKIGWIDYDDKFDSYIDSLIRQSLP